MATTPKTNRYKSRRKWFFKRKGFWLALMVVMLAVAAAGWIYFDQYTRPYRERAEIYDLDRINDLEIPSIIVDRNGKEIGRIFVQNRSIISIDQVPEVFIDALLAGEDSRFKKHQGIDYFGIARAVWFNYKGSTQGASTITQQLARNAFNLKTEAVRREETTIQRKMVEAFLARRIEQRYSKDEILDFYLNRIYFGSGFYGIRSASLGYYGKEPMQLTAAESASLVTLIKNPTNRSPINNPSANRAGRDYVLMRMRTEGMLTKDELRSAQESPLKLNPKPLRRGTTHLYERIADAVGEALGEEALESGGFTVHTTILAEAQNAAYQALRESLSKAESHPQYTRRTYQDFRGSRDGAAEYLQGAVLMMDHETGEVLAHVGGRDYAQVPYDFIEMGTRPLGTAFFPFIHTAALKHGLTPASLVEDEPMDNRAVMVGGREGILGEWGMEVASPVYEGNIPVRRALESSKIAATVRLAGQTGLQRVVDTAVDFGFPLKDVELLPRLAVGFEEVSMKQAVRAMSVFARGGKSAPGGMVYLDRIEDAAGRVVYRHKRPTWETRAVVDEATAWQVHSMMAGSLERGSSAGALDGLLEKPFSGAGKGGSTHDFSDAWFLGYNQRITCGVWTGFLTSSGVPIYPGAFSRDLALPVWQAAMNAAAPSFGGNPMTPPPSVVQLAVCTVSGQRATQFCQEQVADLQTGALRSRSTAVTEYFRAGTEQLPFCGVHSGGLNESVAPGMAINNLPAMDTSPVRPQEPVLLGDDPYHTEVPSFAATTSEPGFVRRRTNVLDSLDLGGVEEQIPLKRPLRLEIHDE